MTDINKLEEQIAKLPIGYITEKVINDKKYYCQQWKENGKIRYENLLSENSVDGFVTGLKDRECTDTVGNKALTFDITVTY